MLLVQRLVLLKFHGDLCFCMDITSIKGDNSWIFMTIWWWKNIVNKSFQWGSTIRQGPSCFELDQYQSGTKPNLVAKIWPPNLATICAWLPKLVDNISSKFHHLVNTGLAIGSLARWLPLNGSPHQQIRHNLSGLFLADWKWLHPIVIGFNTLCPVEFYIQWCVALHQTHWGWYFETLICPCLGS